jgi:hypothetical protein
MLIVKLATKKHKETQKRWHKSALTPLSKSFCGGSRGAVFSKRGTCGAALKMSMEAIYQSKHNTPSLLCKCSPTQWGLAAGGKF